MLYISIFLACLCIFVQTKAVTVDRSNIQTFSSRTSESNSKNSLSKWAGIQKLLAIRGGSQVVHITDVAQLDQQLRDAGNKVVVIDFTASWCMPCRMIAPLYDEISTSNEYGQSTIFLKVDIDEVPEIAEKYQIQSMPTFVFIRDGEVVSQFSGASIEKLQDTLIALQEQ